MSESTKSRKATERPELKAWRKTTADGTTKRVIVGKFWKGPKRIEADPEDLITDPDAFKES